MRTTKGINTLTKIEVQKIKPENRVVLFSYTRFRDGQKVPSTHPAYSRPRVKKEWSFEGICSENEKAMKRSQFLAVLFSPLALLFKKKPEEKVFYNLVRYNNDARQWVMQSDSSEFDPKKLQVSVEKFK